MLLDTFEIPSCFLTKRDGVSELKWLPNATHHVPSRPHLHNVF